MEHFHTIIIGAGPGGLSCAAALAGKGIRVLVVERNPTVGPKVCAGGIPSNARKIFPPQLVEKIFHSQHIFSDLQQCAIQSAEPIILTVDRYKLGQWMLEKACRAGAVVLTGMPVTRITDEKIITPRGEYGYRYLVGADGSSSAVRRFLGLGTEQTGVGIHYQLPGNFERMEWHLNPNLFANGYAWIFPHGDSASVGVYASRASASPRTLLAKLHHWAGKYGIEIDDRRPQAALINYDYRGWHFGNRFLVGDAAGLASGLTGEGIYSAIVSGEAAAAKILDPGNEDLKLPRLIKKHQRHTRLLEASSKGGWRCRILMETLVVALRLGLIHFSALELGVD
jgi:geranylgeranyl reductase